MIASAAILTCSICGDPSADICVYCTKDACVNHRCDRCKRCSDCCDCDVPLSAEPPVVEPVIESGAEPSVAPIAEATATEPSASLDSVFAPEPEQEQVPGDAPLDLNPPTEGTTP